MTAKEYLNRIRHIDIQLRVREHELAKLRQDLCCLQATDYSKDKITGGIPVDMADKVAQLNDLATEIHAEWDALIQLRQEARRNIQQIPDQRYQNILIERYINCKKWEQIAVDTGYSYRRVIQIHGKALQAADKTFPIISLS